MTVYAQKVEDGPNIKVSLTYGSLTVSIEEDYHHLRSFWSQLGSLLDELDKKVEATSGE